MSLSELFIKRPIMTTLVMAAILIFGIFAYRLLPVSDLPNVDFPTILVSASLPGASPDTMASSVATPLEKQFSTIAGIDSMTSTSSLGQTNITIQFNLSRSLDGAALDVQAAITAAGGQLPPEMPTPPTFQKVNPADSPILYLALSSPTMKLSDVDEAAETTIAQNISMVNGVAQVQVYGAQKYAMRAQLDPSALASRQIGIDDVSAALQSGNTNLPTGTLYGQNHTFTILSNGQRAERSAVRPNGDGLSQWIAGPPERTRPRHRQRAERQDRELVQRGSRHRAGDPETARHQYGCGGRQHQEVAAPARRPHSRRRPASIPSTTAPSPFAPR